MHPEIETVFMLTLPEHTPVNATIIRDIVFHGGDASMFLPKGLDMSEFRNAGKRPNG